MQASGRTYSCAACNYCDLGLSYKWIWWGIAFPAHKLFRTEEALLDQASYIIEDTVSGMVSLKACSL